MQIVPLKKGSKSKRMNAIFSFHETFFPPIQSFKIKNSKVLPADMSDRVMKAVEKYHADQPTGLAVLTTVRNEIENWYLDRGFAYCQLGSFDGLDTGNITLTVSEPKIRNVIVKYVDEQMQEKVEGGHTPTDLVLRTVSLRPGQFYSQFDGRKALQEAFTLQVCFDCLQLSHHVPPCARRRFAVGPTQPRRIHAAGGTSITHVSSLPFCNHACKHTAYHGCICSLHCEQPRLVL